MIILSITHFRQFEKPKCKFIYETVVFYQEEFMRVAGVICEYNPFHRGHAHHLALAREKSEADYVLCVMSGSVTQRGVFARHDKWSRAKAALLGGADLVIELPARFACSSAQEFASGGVCLLSSLGVVTHLSFGCEEDALPLLSAALNALDESNPLFADALRARLDEGLPYPRARALAAQAVSGVDDLSMLIAQPNAALALEYLRALPASITPVPVVRKGSGYHDSELSALSSATAIRRALSENRQEEAFAAVPDGELLRSCEARGDVHQEEALTQALLYLLKTTPPAALERICGMDEGLEHRFIAAARSAATREELLSLIKTKRYTHARLSRAAMCALLSVTKDFAKTNAAPTYARILGFQKDAAPLLKAIKDRSVLPLITKAADFAPDDPLFALDVRAQDLWSLGCDNPTLRKSGRDFTTSPIIL